MDTQHTTVTLAEKYAMAVLPTPPIMVQFRNLLKRQAGTAAVTSMTNLNHGGLFPVSAAVWCFT